MTTHRITLWINGVPAEYHYVELPYGCKQWYIQGISIDAYHTRESYKLHNLNLKGIHHTPGKRGSLRWGEDLKMTDALDKKWGIYRNLPEFHHDTVWDLYKAIGYNYKKKRYEDAPAT